MKLFEADDCHLSDSRILYYEAIVPISKGDVLWAYYGADYWRDGIEAEVEEVASGDDDERGRKRATDV